MFGSSSENNYLIGTRLLSSIAQSISATEAAAALVHWKLVIVQLWNAGPIVKLYVEWLTKVLINAA